MRALTKMLLRFLLLIGAALVPHSFCLAQDKPNPIDWQDGPTVGKLGDIAQISVPAGYRFTGKLGAQKLLELTQNPTDGNELGALVPKIDKDANFWFSIFEFEDTGYVRDNEKDNLDANSMLESIKNATEESNELFDTVARQARDRESGPSSGSRFGIRRPS